MKVIEIRVVDAQANAALCAPCGGACCQRMPGTVFPRDITFETDPAIMKALVRSMLETGRYSVDWWEGNPLESDHPDAGESGVGYYVRPAVKGAESHWFDPSWGGACTFHSEAGCALSEASRPSECKALIPAADEKCHMPEGWHGKRTGAQAWWPYREALGELREEYSER